MVLHTLANCLCCIKVFFNFTGPNLFIYLTLDEQGKENILLFCTCVGFLANNWFVNYKKIASRLIKLPPTQLNLQGIEIQSRLLFGMITWISRPKIWRLHESLPIKLVLPEPNNVGLQVEIYIAQSDEP